MTIRSDSIDNPQNLLRESSGHAFTGDDDTESSEEIIKSRTEKDSEKTEDDPLLQQIDSFKFNIDEISDTTTKQDEEPIDGNRRRNKKKRRVKPDPPPPVRIGSI